MPVVAYGSNAAPAQLAHKYRGGSVSPVLPVVRARVTGLAVAFSAHMAGYGAVPATVLAAAGTTSTVSVTFVDTDQLELLDGTELGYRRVTVAGVEHPLVLEGGEVLDVYELYVSSHGVLTLDGEVPLLGAIPTAGSVARRLSEEELLAELVGRWPADHPQRPRDAADLVARVRDHRLGPAEVAEVLERVGGRRSSGIAAAGGA